MPACKMDVKPYMMMMMMMKIKILSNCLYNKYELSWVNLSDFHLKCLRLKGLNCFYGRQKKTILQLQQQHLEMEAKLRQALTTQIVQGQPQNITDKLQEYQYDSARLRAQLAQVMADKDAEIAKLEKKLGSVYHFINIPLRIFYLVRQSMTFLPDSLRSSPDPRTSKSSIAHFFHAFLGLPNRVLK